MEVHQELSHKAKDQSCPLLWAIFLLCQAIHHLLASTRPPPLASNLCPILARWHALPPPSRTRLHSLIGRHGPSRVAGVRWDGVRSNPCVDAHGKTIFCLSTSLHESCARVDEPPSRVKPLPISLLLTHFVTTLAHQDDTPWRLPHPRSALSLAGSALFFCIQASTWVGPMTPLPTLSAASVTLAPGLALAPLDLLHCHVANPKPSCSPPLPSPVRRMATAMRLVSALDAVGIHGLVISCAWLLALLCCGGGGSRTLHPHHFTPSAWRLLAPLSLLRPVVQ